MAKQDDITAMPKITMHMRQDDETRRGEHKEREEIRWEEREREGKKGKEKGMQRRETTSPAKC